MTMAASGAHVVNVDILLTGQEVADAIEACCGQAASSSATEGGR